MNERIDRLEERVRRLEEESLKFRKDLILSCGRDTFGSLVDELLREIASQKTSKPTNNRKEEEH